MRTALLEHLGATSADIGVLVLAVAELVSGHGGSVIESDRAETEMQRRLPLSVPCACLVIKDRGSDTSFSSDDGRFPLKAPLPVGITSAHMLNFETI